MSGDHGAGWYDRIEIDGPKGIPLPDWLTPDYRACPDCGANLFLRWDPDLGRWHSSIAHDDGCPTLAALDRPAALVSGSVVIEFQPPGGDWGEVGRLHQGDPPGSLSSEPPEGRQIFVFGWYNGAGPAVWRSLIGIDVDDPLTRMITTTGIEQLADLTAGPFELDLVTRAGELRARWSYSPT